MLFCVQLTDTRPCLKHDILQYGLQWIDALPFMSFMTKILASKDSPCLASAVFKTEALSRIILVSAFAARTLHARLACRRGT